jgi:hypothetical protein
MATSTWYGGSSFRALANLRAFRFFAEHAGYVVGERAKGALALARAERDASEAGVEFVWEYDDDADYSWMNEEEAAREHTVERVRAVLPCDEHGIDCKHARTLGSLSGIFDADANYRRVIEAELALEASDEIAALI